MFSVTDNTALDGATTHRWACAHDAHKLHGVGIQAVSEQMDGNRPYATVKHACTPLWVAFASGAAWGLLLGGLAGFILW